MISILVAMMLLVTVIVIGETAGDYSSSYQSDANFG
tara:strand:+ start:247 stop:354 length:108 start_codon:yes stop_codon:yes gene_type:complete